MDEWHQLGERPGPIWRCKTGHKHRGRRPDGSPCTYKKIAKAKERAKVKKQGTTNYAKLMGAKGARAQPKRVTGVVRGGLPSLGKKR